MVDGLETVRVKGGAESSHTSKEMSPKLILRPLERFMIKIGCRVSPLLILSPFFLVYLKLFVGLSSRDNKTFIDFSLPILILCLLCFSITDHY